MPLDKVVSVAETCKDNTFQLKAASVVNQPSPSQIKFNVDLSIYSQEALNLALYDHAGRFYIHQEKEQSAPNIVQVSLLLKDVNESVNEEYLLNEQHKIEQDLLDYQLRLMLENRFGHIRDLIVAEAFKPIS